MSDQCAVSGGNESTEARYTDMRTAAGRLDGSGNEAGDLCKAAFGIGTSLPAKSAILSPGSAVSIAEQITGLTAGLGGLTLRMEFVARTLRWSASAYELTDETQRQLLAAINIATTPSRLTTDLAKDLLIATLEHPTPPLRSVYTYPGELLYNGAAWSRTFASEVDKDLRAEPGLVDGTVAWSRKLLDAFGPMIAPRFHLTPPPQDFEGQIAWILAAGRSYGAFNDTKPLTVKETSERKRPATKRHLADVVTAAADVEHRSDKSKSVLLVRRVVGKNGKGAWVVVIPGTTHWSATTDHGPSDATANLATMAGVPSSLYPAIDRALAAAMKESGVRPGSEPVMVAGHSQGGIVAARLAVDDGFRTKYDVREVVTDGSPIDRMKLPPEVNVLSIENNHDVVPHADGVATPDAINRVDVTCEAPKGEHLHSVLDAHDASRYARSARELTADSNDQLAQWYARNDKYLDGRETDYEFHLRRD